MDSQKVKEIKKVLEEGQFNTIKHHQHEGKPILISFADILTLINELETENKWLVGKVKEKVNEMTTYTVNNQQLKARIAELEKENKDYYDRLNNLQAYIDNHEEIWKGNTNNALKKFVERLKEKCKELENKYSHLCKSKKEAMEETCRYQGVLAVKREIDETLKEFINGKV